MKEIFKNIFKKEKQTENSKPANNIKIQAKVFSPIKLNNKTEITQKDINKDIEKFKQETERIAKQLSNPYKVKHIIWAGINACVIYANGKQKYISKEKALKIKKEEDNYYFLFITYLI